MVRWKREYKKENKETSGLALCRDQQKKDDLKGLTGETKEGLMKGGSRPAVIKVRPLSRPVKKCAHIHTHTHARTHTHIHTHTHTHTTTLTTTPPHTHTQTHNPPIPLYSITSLADPDMPSERTGYSTQLKYADHGTLPHRVMPGLGLVDQAATGDLWGYNPVYFKYSRHTLY